jgi:hypothetical protein
MYILGIIALVTVLMAISVSVSVVNSKMGR